MSESTKAILNKYQNENFVSEQIKAEIIKEEFKSFLDVVVKNDTTIQDVVKVIDETIQTN